MKKIDEEFIYSPKDSFSIWFIIFMLVCSFVIGVSLLYIFKNNISFYRTPAQISQQDYLSDKKFRIGGYIAAPIIFDKKGNFVDFTLSDSGASIRVHYHGFVPGLFREKQGAVVLGKFVKENDYIFIAEQLLTKHDESYHPAKNVLKDIKYVH